MVRSPSRPKEAESEDRESFVSVEHGEHRSLEVAGQRLYPKRLIEETGYFDGESVGTDIRRSISIFRCESSSPLTDCTGTGRKIVRFLDVDEFNNRERPQNTERGKTSRITKNDAVIIDEIKYIETFKLPNFPQSYFGWLPYDKYRDHERGDCILERLCQAKKVFTSPFQLRFHLNLPIVC